MFPVLTWLSRCLVDFVGRSLDDGALVVWLMVSRLCANDIGLDLSVRPHHTVPTANTNTRANTNTYANANINGNTNKIQIQIHGIGMTVWPHHTVPLRM